MRKFVLGLGSIAAVAAPVATVVACGDSDDSTKTINLGSHKVDGSLVKAAFSAGTTAEFDDITTATMDNATSTIGFSAKVKTAGNVQTTSAHALAVGDVISFTMTVDQTSGNPGPLRVQIAGGNTTIRGNGVTALQAAVVTAIGAILHPTA